jgi:hypothetical protein
MSDRNATLLAVEIDAAMPGVVVDPFDAGRRT